MSEVAKERTPGEGATFDALPVPGSGRGDGPSVLERQAVLEKAVGALEGLADVAYQAGGEQLVELVAVVDRLAVMAAAGRFALTREAHARGEVAESDAPSLAAWVKASAASTRQGGCGAIATAVRSLGLEINAPVREAVESGRVSVTVANAVVAEIGKIDSRLAEGVRDTVVEAMLVMGEEHGPAGVRAVRPELLARYGAPDELEHEQARMARGRALSQPTVDDGLHEYRLVLDPEGAAVLETALSALSAPAPCEDAETGRREPDLRTSDQRRADALVEVVRAAVTSMDTRSGRGAKATLLVTMTLADLQDRTYAGTTISGSSNGNGTHPGALLAPETVRKMACDGAVVPVVLGSRGEIVDQGREVRLFTTAQTRNLVLRDGGCTYPGCGAPSAWADAHHLVHWADGGASDLSNAALLCGRHHTIVHSRRLRGWVADPPDGGAPSGRAGSRPAPSDRSANGPPRVVWDLTPGSYDRSLAAAAEPRAG